VVLVRVLPAVKTKTAAGIALAVVVCAMLVCSNARAQSPSTQWPPAASKQIPNPLGSPVSVKVAIFLANLTEIDELDERFTVTGYLFLTWKDPRLAYVPTSPSETRREVPLENIWVPSINLVNQHEARESISRLAFVDPEGTVRYQEEFVAHLSAELNLRKFPFDTENLHILVQPLLADAETNRVLLMKDPSETGVARARWTGLAQWDIVGVSMADSSFAYGNRAPMLPALTFTLTVKRQYPYYLWKIFFPLILIVIVAYSAFFVEIKDHYTQITIALTTILTVIAFSFSVESSMPKVPYLTYIDCFFLATYVLVFLSMIVLVVTHTMIGRKSDRRAIQLRRLWRYTYVILFVIVNIAIVLNFFA
jgi:hypothetical protein